MIVDTNALSALADGDSAAVAEFEQAGRVAVPVVVLGEYRFGIAQLRTRSEYEAWLLELLLSATVLDVTDDTTIHYAEVRLELKRNGTPIPSNDVWIAALARQHGFPILSRNKHFDAVGRIRRIHW
jgi:tRNA(fMet)-specific endonuclease VapC